MVLRTSVPKLALNAFIKKYKTGNCIGFSFYDYKPGRRRERATGKQLPTPNQVVAAFARQAVKGDYMVASHKPAVQLLVFADDKEALAIATKLKCQRGAAGGPETFCKATVGCNIAEDRHVDMAIALGLF